MALLEVGFFSNVLEMSMSMNVILPQQTPNQIGMIGKKQAVTYPTLYLLHGMSDDHTSWLRRSSIERYASELGIAVVMPTTHLAWYSDTQYGLNYWEFISEELPAICREFFPNMSTKREETFAAGLSMGGFGALKLGLGNSETFGAVASLSGALDIESLIKIRGGEKSPYWKGVFGEMSEIENSPNDLFYLAEKLVAEDKPKPAIFIWCGEQDFLYQDNLRGVSHLEKLGYPVTKSFSEGDHQWKYWDSKIAEVLDWLMALSDKS